MNAQFSDLMSVDPLGFQCIPEDLLDAAFARADKPVLVPRTCDTGDQFLDPGVLAQLLGHTPSAEEWSQYQWRYLHFYGLSTTSLPGKLLYSDNPSPVPVPGSSVGLLTAMLIVAFVGFVRRRRHA